MVGPGLTTVTRGSPRRDCLTSQLDGGLERSQRIQNNLIGISGLIEDIADHRGIECKKTLTESDRYYIGHDYSLSYPLLAVAFNLSWI